MENKKEAYLRPECSIYETELEGCILTGSGEDKVSGIGNTSVNSFVSGREYDTSVF